MTSDLTATRVGLQQVAVHVLARRRFAVAGRFGLRPTPGGLGTPAFGVPGDPEVVRTSGRFLVVERGAGVTIAPITTLAAAAALVGVDLTEDFSVGTDTPVQAPVDEPLTIDDDTARTLGTWWAFGLAVIDEAVATGGALEAPTVSQIWPEHFDLGCTVERGGEHLNLGASPGDAGAANPYLYVGPWSSARPGSPSYWNAPFGAVLRMSDVDQLPSSARRSRALAFFAEGLGRF